MHQPCSGVPGVKTIPYKRGNLHVRVVGLVFGRLVSTTPTYGVGYTCCWILVVMTHVDLEVYIVGYVFFQVGSCDHELF